LKSAWPQLLSIAETFSNFQSISSALGDVLSQSLNMECTDDDRAEYHKELCDMAKLVIRRLIAVEGTHIHPILTFVIGFVESVGINAEIRSEILTDFNQMTVDLLKAVFDFFYSRMNFSGKFNGMLCSLIFETLTKFVKRCPVLFRQISESYSLTGNEGVSAENMLEYWIEQAQNSLSQKNIDKARNASFFLKAMVDVKQMRNQQQTLSLLRSSTETYLEIILSLRKRLICRVLLGICTFYEKEMIDPTSALIFSILTSFDDNEEDILFALAQDEFKLPEACKTIVLKVLSRCESGNTNCLQVTQMFIDIWKLHKMETNQEVGSKNAMTTFLKNHSPI